MVVSVQSGRLCPKMLRNLAKENYKQLLIHNKVNPPSLFIATRNVHQQRRIPLLTNYSSHTSKLRPLSIPLLIHQFEYTTEAQPPLKKTGILKKILKISLGSAAALLTTGGLLIAKNVYQDEDDPVSPENLTAPGKKAEIDKEWVEFMLTNYETRQNAGTKVVVNSFEVGDATQKGDGYAGEHVKLLVNATIQVGATEEQSSVVYDKDYNLFLKFNNPHPVMEQMMKHNKNDLNELLLYSDIMDDFRKFQAKKTDENVCPNTPNYVYGKWTNKQFVLVMENMKPLGFGQNPKENGLNLHQAKLGLEQLARLHAISHAYDKEHNLLDKYPTYNMDHLRELFLFGYELFLDMSIEFLKGREGTEEIVKKISSTKSKLAAKVVETLSYDTKIKSLVHADCWNNNFLFKSDIDENGQQTFTKSDKMLILDFQGLHWSTPIFDVAMFVYRNTTPQFRKKHSEELLTYYHSTFTDILTKLNCSESNWTYEQFKSEYDRAYPWHLMFGYDSAILQSEAIKEMSMGKSDPGPSGPMWKKIKAAAAKLVVPIMMNPWFLENFFVKDMMGPFFEELIEDKSRAYCDLMFNVLLEAEENGIFDESRF